MEIKGDKQPIGKYANPQPFNSYKIQLKKGDIIYLTTDGFQDQFGGDKGKKFKASSLKSVLLQNSAEPMKMQLQILENELETWRGNLEQVDDVCVIGVGV